MIYVWKTHGCSQGELISDIHGSGFFCQNTDLENHYISFGQCGSTMGGRGWDHVWIKRWTNWNAL